MQGTISEKIFSRASGGDASANDFVSANIDYAMAHDGTSVLALHSFQEMGVEKVWDADKIIVPFDHLIPASTEAAALLQKKTRDWVKEQGISHFYEGGEGICHQVLPEKGFALPGKLIIGADSHSCTYGAFGAFGTGVGATDMAEIFASGKLWFRVPETIKMTVDGTLQKGVFAKDLTLYLIGKTGISGATYKAVEYYGTAISDLSVAGRMTLCNMAIEMGAKAGIVPPDEKTFSYLKGRAAADYEPVYADSDANYLSEKYYDADDIEPQIACPHEVDNVVPISKVIGTPIDQAFIGTCTNGRLEDLAVAADILKGKTVKVRTIATPASRAVLLDAVESGIFETLVKAGVSFITPGCGPCLGAHQGVIAEGETCLSTANRNFRGRMGKGGNIYLGSPATVAASAITGEITDPREFL
ncbi:3-isopropylmalate dehydratase large subunit [Methanolapillus millepedarum]|uniref:3-isopropylmalate dehydratase large subunit n=1 Tax=Methanolapillus millepedarum TaxID=3028296 RepID=A0AA96ZVI2_9EURY|nr:3-isopropylmalate dehydratase large subunit [Methanosarcinaceae archaeon Ac7]